MSLKPEDELKGRYKIISVLGKGGMGAVYLAKDWLYQEECALKEMLDNFVDEEEREEAIKRFKNEAQFLVKLKHKNIPPVTDYFIENNCYYIVMKYIPGKNLQEIIIDKKDGVFAQNQVIEWGTQICEVLSYLHNNKPEPVVFRDIKPSNIMITPDGTVMLVDFGIAKILQARKPGTITGTPGFAAPEQYQGLAYPVSDIYSLGATLYYLLTGIDPRQEAPFTFPRIERVHDQTSNLEDVIMKSLEMKMQDRYQTAREFRDALLFCRKTELKLSPPEFILPLEKEEYRELTEDVTEFTSIEKKLEDTYPQTKEKTYETVRKEDISPLSPITDGRDKVEPEASDNEEKTLKIDFVKGTSHKEKISRRDIIKEAILQDQAEKISSEDIEEKVGDKVFKEPFLEPHPTEIALNTPSKAEKKKIAGRFFKILTSFLIFLIFLGILFFFARDFFKNRKIDNILDEARQAMDAEDYDLAISRYKEVIVLYPDSIEAYRGLGKAYMEKEEYDYARLHLERALEIDGEDEDTILAMADLYWEREDIFNARVWYKKVLVINEDNPLAINSLGDTYFAEGDYTSAIVEYKKLLEIDPESIPVRLKIATAYNENEEYENAVKWYTMALEIKDNTPDARKGIAEIYVKSKNYDDAIEEYKKILKYNKQNKDALAGIAETYRKKKEYDNAEKWFDELLEVDPDSIDGNRGKADIYIARNEKLEEALAKLNFVIKQDPEDPLVYHSMGNYYVIKKDFARAIKNYKKSIELDPEIAFVYYNLGRVYAYQEKYEEAISEYKEAIDLDPLDPYFHYNLGRSYYKNQELEEAGKEYNISIKLKSDYAAPYYGLGMIYFKTGKYQEAVAYFNKVIELDPDSDLAKEAEKGIKFAQYYF